MSTSSITRPHHTMVDDQFLSARVASFRRLPSLNTVTMAPSQAQPSTQSPTSPQSIMPTHPRPSRRPSSATSSLALGSVPEDARPPPSAYRKSQSSHKGKEKEMTGGMSKQKRPRVEWSLDLLEAQRGAEKWGDRERIVLVLGSEFFSDSQTLAEGGIRCDCRYACSDPV
jgi:hypothetical protein